MTMVINPKNTSREYPECHTIGKKNRPERSYFKCVYCGLAGEADSIASLNIWDRTAVSRPIVAGSIFDHLIIPVTSSEALARRC